MPVYRLPVRSKLEEGTLYYNSNPEGKVMDSKGSAILDRSKHIHLISYILSVREATLLGCLYSQARVHVASHTGPLIIVQ